MPGYLGAKPTESLARARVQHKTTVRPSRDAGTRARRWASSSRRASGVRIADAPVAIQVGDLPDASLMGAMLT